MEFNGAIVSKPLKDELNKVLVPLEEKVEKTAENAMEYRGAWANNTQYYKNDVVTFDTSVYIAIKDNKGATTPPLATNSWKKIGITQQRASKNIPITEIGTYEPQQNPEAVFSATLESQNIMLRIVKVAESEDGVEYTLSSPIISGTNSSIIYAIVVKVKSNIIKAYKTTLTASGATTVEISAPATVTVYYDYMS